MIVGAATVAVYVTDSDDAVRFWVEQVAFELRAERSMGPGKWIEVAPQGAGTALVLYPKSMMSDWDSRRPSVVFEAADIEATCRELETNGVEFSQRLTEMPWGKFAAFLDPEGNEFGIRESA